MSRHTALIAGAIVVLAALAGGTGVLAPRAAAGQVSPGYSSLEARLRAGLAAQAEGDLRLAIAIFRSILTVDPDNRQAAQFLRELAREPGHALPVDELAAERTTAEAGPGFARYETEHFIIFSDCDREWTISRARLLDRTYYQFHRMMRRLGLEGVPPAEKLQCVLIDRHEDYAAFARRFDGVDAAWIAGYYASRNNRVVFYNDADSPAFRVASQQLDEFRTVAAKAEKRASEARRSNAGKPIDELEEQAQRIREHIETETVRLESEVLTASVTKSTHEAAHLIAFNCGLQSRAHQYPFWLTEGLATCFETLAPDRPFGPDEPFAEREREFREAMSRDRLITLEAFVSMNNVPGEDAETARVMYAQAYALFRYLFRYEREKLAAYFRDIMLEPPGMISTRRHGEMFIARFGDPARLERQWLREEERHARLGSVEGTLPR